MIQPDGEAVDLPAYLALLKDANAKPDAAVTWTDRRTLATARDWVCWWRPAGFTDVFIGGKAKRVWLPALVFVGGQTRRVWVVRNGRPTPQTMLRIGGWSNTYFNGGICWGNGHVPGNLNPVEWEKAFFASSFEGRANFKTKPYAITSHKEFRKLGPALEALRKAD